MKYSGLIVLICIFLFAGSVSGAPSGYLNVKDSYTPLEKVKIDQPVSGEMELEVVGNFTPESATLKIETDLERPRVEVTINGGEIKTYEGKLTSIPVIPEMGVKITISGKAPEVSKETRINVIKVSSVEKYTNREPEEFSVGALNVQVTSDVIQEVKDLIHNATVKATTADSKVEEIKLKGLEYQGFAAEVAKAKESISNAEKSHDQGDIVNARLHSINANDRLDRVISDMEKKSSTTSFLIYGLAVVVVIVLLGGILYFLKSRRGEDLY